MKRLQRGCEIGSTSSLSTQLARGLPSAFPWNMQYKFGPRARNRRIGLHGQPFCGVCEDLMNCLRMPIQCACVGTNGVPATKCREARR
eukprot:1161585-Pelagomonas_calceolata.AAC.26